MSAALCVAVLGAESTGKTTLAQALALQLAEESSAVNTAASPLRTAWVPEVLRQWCDKHGRTPQAHEQAAILAEQHARIDAAALAHDLVVCDTTGLMTAVYSQLIFGDHSLQAQAVQLHRRMDLSLLMALDLPWVADGHQRDGPQVREPVDTALRMLLLQHQLPFAVISGSGPGRLQQAVAAVAPLLRRRHAAMASPRKDGLFTGLQNTGAGGFAARSAWLCECCGDAHYERALRARAGFIGNA